MWLHSFNFNQLNLNVFSSSSCPIPEKIGSITKQLVILPSNDLLSALLDLLSAFSGRNDLYEPAKPVLRTAEAGAGGRDKGGDYLL
ncbi:Sorbin And Sh3 Domain-Containing Protein 1 [Manis pentadactyla]|nr:Sorbin And Sh3 Domain-Containing Protein 1 [Manis pentadactyla]